MPRYCVAYGCTNRSDKAECQQKNISFHRFPLKDPNRLRQWLINLQRDNFEPSEHSVLCSEHFNAEDFEYYTPSNKRRVLKPDTVPNKFSFSKPSRRERTSYRLKFPLNDPERLQKWLKALKRESWQPTKHSFLCSQHFTPDSYKSSPKHFLKDDAVPTINCFSTDHPKIVRKRTIDYPLPNPLKKPVVVLQRNSVLEQYSDSNGSPKPPLGSCQCDTLHKSKETVNNKNSSFEANELQIYKDAVCDGTFVTSGDDVSDIEFSDSENTEQRLEIMTAHYKKTKKKLKICQQRCNLYKKEITALKEVIDSLRQINSVSDEN